MGRHGEATTHLERAVALTGRGQTWYLALLAGAYGSAGRRDEALAILSELRDRSAREYVAPFHFSFAHLGLGDHAEAIAALDAACDERNALAWWPVSSPIFDALRGNPRFAKVLEKIVPG
jgi:tetratricopeptide (TPR) repeat protein